MGYGVEIVVRCGGNQRGAMVAVENQHGVVCVALLLAPMMALLVGFFFWSAGICGGFWFGLMVFFFFFLKKKRGFAFGLMV